MKRLLTLAPKKKRRTGVQIADAIKREYRRHHDEPVVVEVHDSEVDALGAAIDILLKAGWGYSYHLHLNEERDAEGWGRFAFVAPGVTMPKQSDRRARLRMFFSDEEIVDTALHSFRDHRVMRDSWERGIKNLQTCRAIAKRGGDSSPSKYKDAEIEAAYTQYRERHTTGTVWEATNALIRAGQPLDKYQHVNSLWQRIDRIAKSWNGENATRDYWFRHLI